MCCYTSSSYTYPSSTVVPVDNSPAACRASFVKSPGASVSSGLKDKLKSAVKGSEEAPLPSPLPPVFNPLQLGLTHVKVVSDLSRRR